MEKKTKLVAIVIEVTHKVGWFSSHKHHMVRVLEVPADKESVLKESSYEAVALANDKIKGITARVLKVSEVEIDRGIMEMEEAKANKTTTKK